MLNVMPAAQEIAKDYQVVLEFATEASTVVDPDLIRKRFRSHVKHQTREGDLIWGRDLWYEFDSLPRSFRDMVNDDPKQPDAALKAAVDLWQSMVAAAERAMDRILRYEAAARDVESWPAFLQGVPSDEIQTITEMREARIELERQLQAKLAEDRAAAKAARKKQEQRDIRTRRISGGISHRFTLVDGTSLRNANIVDTSGLRPHEIRALEMTGAKPVKFAVTTYISEDRVVKLDPGAAADAEDRLPPVKIHPMHFKRGRNF